MMINSKNHNEEKQMPKSNRFIKKVIIFLIIRVFQYVAIHLMIALAELQSIEKSHFLWQELTNDNGSVSILLIVFCYLAA